MPCLGPPEDEDVIMDMPGLDWPWRLLVPSGLLTLQGFWELVIKCLADRNWLCRRECCYQRNL